MGYSWDLIMCLMVSARAPYFDFSAGSFGFFATGFSAAVAGKSTAWGFFRGAGLVLDTNSFFPSLLTR